MLFQCYQFLWFKVWTTHSYTQSDNSINVRRGASYEAAPYIKEVVVPTKNSNGNTQSG